MKSKKQIDIPVALIFRMQIQPMQRMMADWLV